MAAWLHGCHGCMAAPHQPAIRHAAVYRPKMHPNSVVAAISLLLYWLAYAMTIPVFPNLLLERQCKVLGYDTLSACRGADAGSSSGSVSNGSAPSCGSPSAAPDHRHPDHRQQPPDPYKEAQERAADDMTWISLFGGLASLLGCNGAGVAADAYHPGPGPTASAFTTAAQRGR
jgi:hypothetical protein